MAVRVIVAHPHAHSRLLHAIVAECNPAQHTFLSKGSVMVVHKQQTWGGVACDEDVGPSIFIEIRSHHRHSIALRCFRNACLLAYVRERTVTIVAVQRMSSRGQSTRSALDRNTFPIQI